MHGLSLNNVGFVGNISLVDSNVSLSYIGSAFVNNNLASYTFTTPTITAGLAIVSVHSEIGVVAAQTPTSVTIGSTPATLAVSANTPPSGSLTGSTNSSIWYAVLTSSTTSVQVTYPATQSRSAIGVNVATGYSSTTPFFIETSITPEAPDSRSITTSVLGQGYGIIAAHTSGDKYNHSWTGVTERYDTLFGTGTVTGPTGASLVTASRGNVIITVTPAPTGAATQTSALAVAVWR